jgi:hypothetical protein
MTARARNKLEAEIWQLTRELENARADLYVAEDAQYTAWKIHANLKYRLKSCREKLEAGK